MKVVLQAVDGFYAGTYIDKNEIRRPRHVSVLDDAQVFELFLENGAVFSVPQLPQGNLYELKAISLLRGSGR